MNGFEVGGRILLFFVVSRGCETLYFPTNARPRAVDGPAPRHAAQRPAGSLRRGHRRRAHLLFAAGDRRATRSPTSSATRSARSPSRAATTRSSSTRTSSSGSRTSRASSCGACLHSYPFYNSEQSSQRYVKLNEPRAFVPPLAGEALRRLRAGRAARVGRLRRALGAAQGRRLGDPEGAALRAADRTTPARLKAVEREAEKKAIETARYVIPIARVHLDGAHGVGHRAAPPAPDAERRRHALRGARW